MRGALAACLFGSVIATGCIANEAPMDLEPEPEPEPTELVADANGCHGVATLDGSLASIDGGRANFGPHIFGHGRFCLHLDASTNRRAHFMAETDRFDGEHSPISFVLERADGTMIVEGWDVAFGMTDTRVFTNVELAVEGGTELDVVLVVDAASVGSTIGVAFFDPLE